MTSPSDNLLERFQSDRSEYFSPPICEILREYEAWRSEASNDLVGEMESGLERIAKKGVGAGSDWSERDCATYWANIVSNNRRIASDLLSRMRDARKGGGGQ